MKNRVAEIASGLFKYVFMDTIPFAVTMVVSFSTAAWAMPTPCPQGTIEYRDGCVDDPSPVDQAPASTWVSNEIPPMGLQPEWEIGKVHVNKAKMAEDHDDAPVSLPNGGVPERDESGLGKTAN